MKIVIKKGEKVKVKDSIISTDTYVKNIRSRKEEKNNTITTGKLSVSVVKNNKKQKTSEEEFDEVLKLNKEVKDLEQKRIESNEPEVIPDDLEEKEIENNSEEVSESTEEPEHEETEYNHEESVDEDTETEYEESEEDDEEEEEFVPRIEAPFPAVAPGSQKKKANAQHKQKEKEDVEYKVVRRQKKNIPEDSKMENY